MKNAKDYNDDISANSTQIINNSNGSNIKKETENFLNMIKDEGYQDENEDNEENEDNDEESKYMHDKSIIKKLKQLNPIILNTLENMNSVHIKEINKTINNLTDKIDP